MSSITRLWIFVGLVLWGFPTGLLLSFMLANLSFTDGIKLIEFQPDRFKMYLALVVPLFCVAGFFLGVYMGKLTEESRRQ